MIIRYTITTDLMNQRTHGRVMRSILRTAMVRHRDHRLGKHYQDIAETQPGGGYGYEKRKEGYQEAKLKVKGHRRPLVWSGRTARYVRNNSRITATQHRARLVARNYFPLTQQRRNEIEAVTDAETREISKGLNEHYLAEAAKPGNRRQRRRRIG